MRSWNLFRSFAGAFISTALIFANGLAEDKPTQIKGGAAYSRPGALDFVTKFPSDLKEFGKKTFRRETVPAFLLVAGSTGLLLLVDQKLVNSAHHMGDELHISHTNY